MAVLALDNGIDHCRRGGMTHGVKLCKQFIGYFALFGFTEDPRIKRSTATVC